MDEWMKKMWCIDTIDLYSVRKKNEIVSLTGKLMGTGNNNK
jgi:hypothetical protein